MPFRNHMHAFWSKKSENELIDSVQIFLWSKGMCVTGHKSNGDLTAGIAYSYDQVYELKILENLILNEPLLADAALVKRICMSVSRHLMIPQTLINKENRTNFDEWIHALHYIEHDEDISTSHQKEIGADFIYPKKKVVKDILRQYFPERSYKFYIAPTSLLQENQKDCVCILFLGNNCSLTFYKNNKVIHYTIIDWENAEDVYSRVVQIAELMGIELGELQWKLGGITSDMEDIQDRISSYLPSEQIQFLSPESTFKAFCLCE